jgi:hypothetical protein
MKNQEHNLQSICKAVAALETQKAKLTKDVDRRKSRLIQEVRRFASAVAEIKVRGWHDDRASHNTT